MVRSSLVLLGLALSFAMIGCSGGSDEDSPTPSTTPTAACSNYCTDIMAVCTDANAQYDSQDACLTACAGFATTGTDGDTSGNTLQCRAYHLTVAATDATHCSHAGETGDGVCVDAAARMR